MSNIQTVRTLLENVVGITVKYEPVHREHRFNIFTILRRGHEEVALHSRFIAELLDPKGKHGHGDEFLKLFLQYIVGEDARWLEEDDGGASVEIERPFLAENVSGRIDILIRTPSRIVVLENKIYASDQSHQLDRYCDFAKSETKKLGLPLEPIVCYLTLQGDIPEKSTWSKEPDHPALRVLSYRDIRDWLGKCVGMVAFEPALRETIRQYQLLIDKLRGETMSKDEKQEVISAIRRSEESVIAAQAIHKAWYDARTAGILEYWESIDQRLTAIMARKYSISEVLDVQKYTKKKVYDLVSHSNKVAYANHGVMIALSTLKDGSLICFYVEASASEGMIYGITMMEYTPTGTPNRKINEDPRFGELRSAIIPDSFHQSPWWLGWAHLPGVPNIAHPYRDDVLDLMLPEPREKAVSATVEHAEKLLIPVMKGLEGASDLLR